MTKAKTEATAIALFSEVMALEHILRHTIARDLPKGMELSHFVILNHLAHVGTERTPAQLAVAFNLSRGAITNTLSKLEVAGYIHIRPDWDDARRKQVVISSAGRLARDAAFEAVAPMLSRAVDATGEESLKVATGRLRQLRQTLMAKD